MNDPLNYPVTRERSEYDAKIAKIFGIIIGIAILFIAVLVLLTSGCVSTAKNIGSDIYYNWGETPTPEPTAEIVIEQPEVYTIEPTPVPTESMMDLMLRTNGHYLREWVHWYRPNVEGIQPGPQDTGDLSAWVTVYGYKLLPSYHWYSVSWARNFLVRPEGKDNQFLFFYVNEYIDDYSTRQYGFHCSHFAVNYDGRMYIPDPVEYPERRITEFDEIQNYGRTESMKPFGYKIIQEIGTGIYRAEQREFLYSGRSNAWDGYCMVEIPYEAKPENITVYGSFANLGGNQWWTLTERPAEVQP